VDPARTTLGAVVLAGGRSSRMGADKSTLAFCGARMIDRVTRILSQLTDRIVVVARAGHGLDDVSGTVIHDEEPFAGPLPALVAGLRATGAERALVVACDMPFLNAPLLMHLIAAPGENDDAAIPLTLAGPEPLHALYRDCAIEPLLAALAAGERSLRGAVERLTVRWVPEEDWRPIDPDGRSFLNVNTPDELDRAATMQTSR
jgi:molybdopterin-guanine dinucleotide biosynthesis protein A